MVKYYWYFAIEDFETPYTHTGYPYGAFELIYYVKNPNKMRWLGSTDQFYEPGLFYSGQLTKPFELYFEKSCICAGISFQPWIGNALFPLPGNELRNELVPFSEISKNNFFPDHLGSCSSPGEIFDCFEEFLLANLSMDRIDPLVMQLARSITMAPNYETLAASLKTINLSRRRIEQRFLSAAGLSLGLFIKKMRFQHSLRMMGSMGNKNLNNISAELDYYDQSHFVHDFKKFAGITPREYLYTNSRLSDFFQQLTEPAMD